MMKNKNPIGRSTKWSKNNWQRFYFATLHSVHGFKAVFLSEQAFRWNFYIGILLFAGLAGLWQWSDFFLPFHHLALLLLGFVLLLAFELINSGIEALCDLVHPNYHQVIKAVKDMGSASIFLCYIYNIIVWGWLVAIPIFFQR